MALLNLATAIKAGVGLNGTQPSLIELRDGVLDNGTKTLMTLGTQPI